MKYETFRTNAERMVKLFGQPINITRNGVITAVGHGVFTNNVTSLDTTTPGLQTSLNTRSVLVTLTAEPLVGDLLTVIDTTETHPIKKVEVVRPTNLTIIHKLEI
jgi:hypothetical protein